VLTLLHTLYSGIEYSVTRGPKMDVVVRKPISRLADHAHGARAVEESLRQQGNGELSLHPRRRLKLADKCLLHYMAAGESRSRIYQYEDLHKRRGVVRFMVPLFRSALAKWRR